MLTLNHRSQGKRTKPSSQNPQGLATEVYVVTGPEAELKEFQELKGEFNAKDEETGEVFHKFISIPASQTTSGRPVSAYKGPVCEMTIRTTADSSRVISLVEDDTNKLIQLAEEQGNGEEVKKLLAAEFIAKMRASKATTTSVKKEVFAGAAGKMGE